VDNSFISDIIKVVREHSGMSPVHKQIIINRISKVPTEAEIQEAVNDLKD